MIKREFGLSKNAFKRAVGHLLKEGKIEIKDKRIYKKIMESDTPFIGKYRFCILYWNTQYGAGFFSKTRTVFTRA